MRFCSTEPFMDFFTLRAHRGLTFTAGLRFVVLLAQRPQVVVPVIRTLLYVVNLISRRIATEAIGQD